MKGIFLHYNSDSVIETSGEVKKVKMQIEALRLHGIDVKEICIDKSKRKDCFTRRIPFYPSSGRNLFKSLLKEDIVNCDFIYIRKYIIDLHFLHVLKKIKEEAINIKILLEVPTYPYDLEWNRLIDKPILWKERHSRNRLHKYINTIITLSNDDYIWSIKTIKISNGIDLAKIKPKIKKAQESDRIILIGVALVTKTHGYDRLIKGLSNYYESKPEREVEFWLVGTGPEWNNLKDLVSNNKLEEYVKFKGKKYGRELDDLYDKADIAIGCLGFYRVGIEYGSSLKLREYCAKGIPFIKADKDRSFDDMNFEYMLEFANDDSDIDISKIVDFYDELQNEKYVGDNMRKYAETNLTWTKEMKSIVDYIKL